MSMWRKALITTSVLGLGGCASNVSVVDFYEASSETLHRFGQITVLDDSTAPPPGLVRLGEVDGIYCKKQHGQANVGNSKAELQAIDQVKLKAAELGADVIAKPSCDVQKSNDFANNCFGTVICRASAYRRSK